MPITKSHIHTKMRFERGVSLISPISGEHNTLIAHLRRSNANRQSCLRREMLLERTNASNNATARDELSAFIVPVILPCRKLSVIHSQDRSDNRFPRGRK
mmetsp:Transcript_28634/g.69373  ORF Transcript_28634/g.69373 Transcript_28634/m.69373 type:complete len:100 (+) Transcript_28634:2082-2381(+)